MIQGNAASVEWQASREGGRMRRYITMAMIQDHAASVEWRAFREGGRMQCVPALAFGEGRPSPIVPRPSKTG